MRNNFIKRSIIGGYLVIVTIIIVAAGVVYYSTTKVNNDINGYTQRLLKKDFLLDRFRNTSNNIQAATVQLLYLEGVKNDSFSISKINEMVHENSSRLDSLSILSVGTNEKALLQQLRSARDAYNNSRAELYNIASKDPAASLQYYFQSEIPAFIAYQKSFNQIETGYFAENHRQGSEISNYVASSIRVINLLLILVVIIIFAIGRILWLTYKQAIDAQKIAETRELQFEKLLEASPDALIAANKSGKIIYVNKQACNLFQYTQAELLNGAIEMLMPDRFAHKHTSHRNRYNDQPVNRAMGKLDMPLFGKKKDGTEFPIEISLNSFETEEEQVVLSTIRDISDKKKYEEKLQRSESFTRGILDSLSSHIVVIDREGTIITVNEAWNSFAESNRDPLNNSNSGIGSNYFDVCKKAAATGDEDAQKTLEGLQDVLNNKKSVFYLEYPCHSIAEQRWFALRAVRFNSETPMIVISHQNITQRVLAVNETKKLANQIIEISSSVPGAVYQFQMRPDGSFAFPYISKGFEDLTGVHPDKIYHDASLAFATVISEDVFDMMNSIYHSANTMTPWLFVFRIVHPADKKVKWIRGNSIPSKADDGSVVWNGTMIDISDVKIIEEQLIRNNRELKKTNEELDRFVYSTSHDLRSPLTSVLGLADIIAEESTEENTLTHIEMIRNRIIRLDAYIRNILSYSKNNRTEVSIAKLNIEQIIHDSIDYLKNAREHSDIQFTVDIKSTHPLHSDAARLTTIIENVIGNSLKYHKKNVEGRYVKVMGEINKNICVLSIEDNGIGIDPIHQKRIFDMFYRITGNVPGAGIGLYLAKEMVEKLDGEISVTSIPGEKTTFTIKFKNHNP
jgi:PAS domain S-box-containing protein